MVQTYFAHDNNILPPSNILSVPLYQVKNGLSGLKGELKQLREMGFTDLHLTPLFKPKAEPTYTKDGRYKQGNSPYAMISGTLDKRYTHDGQMSFKYSKFIIQDFVDACDDEGIQVFADFVYNHVGASVSDYILNQTEVAKKDPIFGLLAKDVEEGVIKLDDVLCCPEQKRNMLIAGDWTDTCEWQMDTPEQIANAIKYFAIPYTAYMAECYRPKGDPSKAVNARIDASNMLPPQFWQAFAPIMTEMLSGKSDTDKKQSKILPKVVLETIDPLDHYAGVVMSFPTQMRSRLMHQNYASHFALVDNKNKHPFETTYEITQNNAHFFWHGVHRKSFATHPSPRDMWATNGIAVLSATHDTAECDGNAHMSLIHGHAMESQTKVKANRQFNALEQFSLRHSWRVYGEHINDLHCQHSIFDAKTIDSETYGQADAIKHTGHANKAALSINKTQFGWVEAMHVWGHPEIAALLLHRKNEQNGFQPHMVFVNNATASANFGSVNFADVLKSTYEMNAQAKKQPYVEPDTVHLVGEFSGDHVEQAAARFKSVVLNGEKVKTAFMQEKAHASTWHYDPCGQPLLPQHWNDFKPAPQKLAC